MKPIEYKVIYANGNEEIFYCFGFDEAIVLAMSYAIKKRWGDSRIKYVSSENGTTIKDISINYTYSQ